MIQSKYKFLPILYIRKCKITYLKCFAIELMNVGWRQPTSSQKHDITVAHYIRMLGVHG